MVEQVTAWRDSSGAIHNSKLGAARADAKIQLEKLLGNQVLVTSVLENAVRVVEVLEPFTSELSPQPSPDHSFDEDRYPSSSAPIGPDIL